MKIGVPKEIKNREHRVGLVPGGVRALVKDGHQVMIEKSAGLGSGITDEEYKTAGATIVDKQRLFADADMIIKVKEPLAEEYVLFREDQVLYTYLHLAPAPALTKALLKAKIKAVAYETIQTRDGALPLLTPMSEVAGKMSVQLGAQFLEKHHGGRGVLLGGVPGVNRGVVTIIGGGVVGINAAKIAIGMGARVNILDVSASRLAYLDDVFGNSVTTLMSHDENIHNAVVGSDLVIGAVLIPGAKAPSLVTEEMVKKMKPGSVIVDVAVDQGGCVETAEVTSHDQPILLKHGVLHYAVPNIPGAVSHTSTYALTNVTLKYARDIARHGLEEAVRRDEALRRGVNCYRGKVTHAAVAQSLGEKSVELETLV
ncbi:MAG TPA: alanine dehydrogenase [Elusimicrobia bacterium]|nr:MAG: alanine dehydrogenase [Elusimicrobia bacterium GWA2_66_18]HAZ08023.1 alanine dehydrogenase [Elusimicrobiota bacterium]